MRVYVVKVGSVCCCRGGGGRCIVCYPTTYGSKVVVHILCCYFLSVHNNLQPNPIQTSNSLQVSKKAITNQIIAFFITFVTKTQPTTLIRIRSRTVLHHYLIRIQIL